MTATVVVCTRNRPTLLAACVESVAAALGDRDELVVVESGSSNAQSVLETANLGGRAVLLGSDQREKSHKLNLAIGAASGEVLVLTDDDVVVAPGWIDAMVRPFEVDVSLGVAFGPVFGLSSHGNEDSGLPPGEAPLETWAYAHGASMAIRRITAVDIGGFDERLGPGAPAHGEEHDVLLRAWERGWNAAIVSAPAVHHASWRDEHEDLRNLLVYERGAGAYLGLAIRRSPWRWAKLGVLHVRRQVELLRNSPIRTAAARHFAAGFVYGFRRRPRRFL